MGLERAKRVEGFKVAIWAAATDAESEKWKQGCGLNGRGPPEIEPEAGGDLVGPEEDGVRLSKRGLEVAGDEAMENGVGDEENQPDSEDGIGVMVEVVVGVPGVDDLIEPLVFDLPAGVTEADDGIRGDLS